FLLRLSALTLGWLDHREDVAEMRSAIGLVPPGSRILVATPDESSWVRLAPPRHKVFHHAPQLASLPTLAVIERSAFVSTLYALPSQHSLQLKEPYRHLGGAGSVAIPTLADLQSAIDQRRSPGSTPKQIQRWRQEFDFVLLLYAYGPGADALKGNLPLVPRFDGKTFDLFEIHHP
ncbi:MAG: hypothetical protein ACR2Q4_24050, partial [Geminicoccaceae bacterium]